MKRHLTSICLLFFLSVPSLFAQQQVFPDRYEIEDNEPVYYQELLNRMNFLYSWENAGQKDFLMWQNNARGIIFDCAGIMPPFEEFDYEITGEENREGYCVQQIRLNISKYSRITAYLLVPDGEGPFPALVMLHDHGAEFTIGKEKMVRPFGVSAAVEEKAHLWVEKCYEGVFTADYFARNGYVVFVIDTLYWGERGCKEGSTGERQQALAANLMQMGSSWTSHILADDIRSVQFLTGQSCVDAERIGVIGFSMGAFRSWMLSAVNLQVAATAAISWMSTTEEMMQSGSHLLKGTSAFSMMLPGLKKYMDYPHVASLIAPRPLLLFNGIQDKLFPVKGTLNAYEIMRPVWESQNAAENLVTQLWEVPHIFTKNMQEEVLHFLDKHLKN